MLKILFNNIGLSRLRNLHNKLLQGSLWVYLYFGLPALLMFRTLQDLQHTGIQFIAAQESPFFGRMSSKQNLI